jgi:hypothetical protein
MPKCEYFPAVGLLCLLCCLSCESRPKQTLPLDWSPPPSPAAQAPVETIIRLNSKDPGALPAWVAAYRGGLAGIELLAQYVDKYVFVGENRGDNFNALKLWSESFSAARDAPSLIATRAQNRLVGRVNANPDAIYGGFFEAAVKAFSDADYEDVVREDDFWVYRQISMDDPVLDVETEVKEYVFLILLSIDKSSLVSQINAVLNAVPSNPPLSKDQAAAISHVKEEFFTGF